MKILTFGELMLRLKTPEHLKILQADTFEASYGGAEANVAVSLATLGNDVSYVTKVPEHQVGQAAINEIRRFGVDTTRVLRGGGRVGIYYFEKGTNIRPHRHLNPKKDEIFLLLRGRIAVFLFDNKGEITKTQILDPKEGVYGAEIKAGTWHGLLVLESGSVIYEIKEGPFAPLAPENFAPWSPAPEDTKGVAKYMELLGKAI